MMNLHWITYSREPGILKSGAQYDRHQGKISTAKQYHKELLSNISDKIKRVQLEGTKVIIAKRF